MLLENKVALITGAAKGIGKAIRLVNISPPLSSTLQLLVCCSGRFHGMTASFLPSFVIFPFFCLADSRKSYTFAT